MQWYRFVFMCLICVSFMYCKKETSAAQEESLLSQIPSELRDIFSSESQKLCSDFAQFSSGDIKLENNTWNAQNLVLGSYEQCIYQQQTSSRIIWGWFWSYPDNARGINAYPQIIYGKKPWHEQSTTPHLPIQIETINQLKVSYDLAIARNEGEYNLAYDLWLTANEAAQPEDIRYELMIWEDAHAIVPFGEYRGTVDTTSGSYKFYSGEPTWEPEGTQWTYLAFLRTQTRSNGTVDIDALLNFLIEQDIISDQHYLSSIELGTEVGNSEGYAVLKQFDVTLN